MLALLGRITTTPSSTGLPNIDDMKSTVNKVVPGAGEAVETLLSIAPEVISGLQDFAKRPESVLNNINLNNITDLTKLPLLDSNCAHQLINKTQAFAKSPQAKKIADQGLKLAAKNPAAANKVLPGSGPVVEGLLRVYNNVPGAAFVMKMIMHRLMDHYTNLVAKNAHESLSNLTKGF
jgi:hypothetical protein